MKNELNTKENKLLLLSIRNSLTHEAELKFLLENNLNWEYIIQKAANNRVIPLLYWNLKSYKEYVPKQFLTVIEEHFQHNVRKNLLMWAELKRIIKIFNNQSIDSLPFKGPVLATSAYHNLGLREFNDLDVYVPKKDVIKAREILLNEGYYIYYEIGLENLDKYMEVHNDLKFIKKENKIVLEIHWGFYDDLFTLPSSNKFEVYRSENKVNLNDLEVLNVLPEEMFLILCLHNASHRWDSLILLTDLAEFIKSHDEINWTYIIDKADKLVIKRILNINLNLIRNLLKLQLPPDVTNQMEEDREALIISHKIQNKLIDKTPNQFSLTGELITTLKLREKLSYGIKDVLRALKTPAIYEWEHLPLPTYLWFIYSIYRPLNLLWRYKW